VPPGNSEQHWEADSTRIREELGYQEPVLIEEGINRTVDWERSQGVGEFNPYKFDYAAEDAAAATAN
jgi:dTDP-D-glucose 4,6-dehydratase